MSSRRTTTAAAAMIFQPVEVKMAAAATTPINHSGLLIRRNAVRGAKCSAAFAGSAATRRDITELRLKFANTSTDSAKAMAKKNTSELQSRQYLVCRLLL